MCTPQPKKYANLCSKTNVLTFLCPKTVKEFRELSQTL